MKAKLTALLTATVLGISACSVVDTASINNEAANEYRQMIHKAGKSLDNSSPTAKRIHTIFQRMVPFANAANRTGHPFQWEMAVIRDDELNAWAMPGGKMAVYTGMVEKLNLTDDEIAAVIGHEMTHALLEHSKKESNRNIGINIGAQLGGAVLQAVTGVDERLLNLGVGLATDLGLEKPFSRTAEREADLGGLQLMAQAGYNPEAAVSVWQKMNNVEDNNNLLNKIVSTHPTNNARIKAIRDELPKVMPIYRQAIGK